MPFVDSNRASAAPSIRATMLAVLAAVIGAGLFCAKALVEWVSTGVIKSRGVVKECG